LADLACALMELARSRSLVLLSGPGYFLARSACASLALHAMR
jgi:hypothetical protein